VAVSIMEAAKGEVFRLSHLDRSVLMAERDRVIAILKSCVSAEWISEVGSTALEGVVGKQDIDILVLVPESSFQEVRGRLDMTLRRNVEQLSDDQYQGYIVESPLDVAVQLTVKGCQYDHFHRFIDVLRDSPALRDAYNTLKIEYDGKLMAEYREAKSAFIRSALGCD
jgi:GrpB-like predicted nucleotidyltransferase (UPF0157 family)